LVAGEGGERGEERKRKETGRRPTIAEAGRRRGRGRRRGGGEEGEVDRGEGVGEEEEGGRP
jgi:hypothetical protein